MRHPLTAQCYPHEITLAQFIEMLNADGILFLRNMLDDTSTRYPEEWLEMFARWMELRLDKDRDDEA